jgi:hypothetical protein
MVETVVKDLGSLDVVSPGTGVVIPPHIRRAPAIEFGKHGITVNTYAPGHSFVIFHLRISISSLSI